MRIAAASFALFCFGASTGASPALVPLIESARRQFPPPNVPIRFAEEWRSQLRHSYKLIIAKEYRSSIAITDKWRDACVRYGPSNLAATTLLQLGTAELALFDQRHALPDLLAARRVYIRIGDWAGAASSSFTLSNLYLTLGAAPEAEEAADQALAALARSQKRPLQSNLLLHKARLVARRGDIDAAIPLFRHAIEVSATMGDRLFEATAWSVMGISLRHAKRWEPAEQALTKGIALWNSQKRAEVAGFYASLAELKLARGDVASARLMIDQASRAASSKHAILPDWQVPYIAGLVSEAENHPEAALASLRQAARLVQEAQRHLLPTDSLRVSAIASDSEVYAAYLRVALNFYLSTPAHLRSPSLLSETLVVAEAQRALSLRVSRTARSSASASEEFDRTLDALASLYADAYRQGAADSTGLRRKLTLRLTELEAESAPQLAQVTLRAAGELHGMIPRIPEPEAILRFHLAEPRSFLWELTSSGIRLHVLPPRSLIRSQAEAFLAKVETNSSDLSESGRSLWTTLFGQLSEPAKSRNHWRIVPEDILFQLPFAALVEQPRPGFNRYLIQSRAVSLLPSVWQAPPSKSPSRPPSFLGVADAIYNTADPRFESPQPSLFEFFSLRQTRPSLSLSRLLGSRREVDASLAAFRQSHPAAPVSLLEGRDARWAQIRARLTPGPSVIHLAVHVVPAPGAPDESLIALSLDPSGTAELVGPEAVASRSVPASLVVLSGCRSVRGEIRGGEGLMGLTRAWVAAGASSVLATYWPTLDADPTVQYFYKYWSPSANWRTVPASLRDAQLEMLRMPGWRAEPRVWAAYSATVPLRLEP